MYNNQDRHSTQTNLYPLLFKPILKSVIWGGDKICHFKQIKPCKEGIGESWEISGVTNKYRLLPTDHFPGIARSSSEKYRTVGGQKTLTCLVILFHY